jgi:hypothetical protein
MGTESEPRSLRIEPNGERLGTEWGLEPFTIEQTIATDGRLGHRAAIRGNGSVTVHDAAPTRPGPIIKR